MADWKDYLEDGKDWVNRNLIDRSGVTNIALNVASGGVWELAKTLHQKGGSSDVPKDFYNTPNYRGYTYDSKGNVIGLAPEKTPWQQMKLPNPIDAYYNDDFSQYHGQDDDEKELPDRSDEGLPRWAYVMTDQMKQFVDAKNSGFTVPQAMNSIVLEAQRREIYKKYREEGLDHDEATHKSIIHINRIANGINSTSNPDNPFLPNGSDFYDPDDPTYIVRPDPTNPDNGNKGSKDSGGADGSEIMNFLSNLLAGNSQNVESGIVPGIDDFIDSSHELNEIQMLAMKVKSLNPMAAKELWNMSNLPKEQILEVYHFRYELSLATPNTRERRQNNYGMGIQRKAPYKKRIQSQKRKRLQKRYAKSF